MKTTLLLSLLLLTPAAAGAAGAEAAPSSLVGQKAPDFTAATSAGGSVTLSETTPEKNVVLVFFRGVW